MGRKRENEERDKKIASLYRAGNTLQAIGEIYGVSREWIRQIVSRENITSKEGGLTKRSEINLSALKYLTNKGVPIEKISDELKLGTSRIRQIARENNFPITTKFKARFHAIYPEIKRLHDNGYKQTEIAKELNVSQNLVSKVLVNQYGIRKRRTKKYLLEQSR